MITGWDQGCLGMKIGETRELVTRDSHRAISKLGARTALQSNHTSESQPQSRDDAADSRGVNLLSRVYYPESRD